MKITAPEGILIVLVEFCEKTPKLCTSTPEDDLGAIRGSVETHQTVNWLLSSLKNRMTRVGGTRRSRVPPTWHEIFYRANREANYLLILASLSDNYRAMKRRVVPSTRIAKQPRLYDDVLISKMYARVALCALRQTTNAYLTIDFTVKVFFELPIAVNTAFRYIRKYCPAVRSLDYNDSPYENDPEERSRDPMPFALSMVPSIVCRLWSYKHCMPWTVIAKMPEDLQMRDMYVRSIKRAVYLGFDVGARLPHLEHVVDTLPNLRRVYMSLSCSSLLTVTEYEICHFLTRMPNLEVLYMKIQETDDANGWGGVTIEHTRCLRDSRHWHVKCI